MPLQNRVTPFGEIVISPARGTFMGNRGILHTDNQQLTNRRWTTYAWIICVLNFKGRRRQPMSPRTYTELFFLDEATALAAGHRPCGECRRADYKQFEAYWIAGNNVATIGEIDRVLHNERVDARTRTKVTFQANIDSLADGTFITLDGAPYLIWDQGLWHWTPDGYQPCQTKPRNRIVTVLTPRSTVNALTAGYIPKVEIH